MTLGCVEGEASGIGAANAAAYPEVRLDNILPSDALGMLEALEGQGIHDPIELEPLNQGGLENGKVGSCSVVAGRGGVWAFGGTARPRVAPNP